MRSRKTIRRGALALVAATAIAALVCDAAAADPTVAELLLRIEALERALNEVKRDAAPCPPAGSGVVTAVRPAPPSASGAGVDNAAGSRAAPPTAVPDANAAKAAAVAEARPVQAVAGYKDGFFLASADGAYRLRVGGYVQADSRLFVDNGNSSDVDQFTLRRARLDLRGTLASRFGFRLLPDFAGSKLVLQDAFADVDIAPWLQLRFGKFKTPLGVERLQGSTDLTFIERGLTDNLTPSRDLGLQVSGEFAGGSVAYQLAVLNGVPDGASADGDLNDAVDVAARVFAKPFVTKMYSPLRGAGFGLAATWGREQGVATSTELSPYRTSGRSTFFRYRSDNPATAAGTAVASGGHYRVSPQATWYEGSFGALAEYVRSVQQVDINGGGATWVANGAWQMRASYVLTGEKATYKGVVPDAPFDFGGGHWGAWEVAIRWSSLDVDADVFAKGLADITASARHADAIAVAVNWYLNRNIGFYLDYEHTMFGAGAKSGDRPDEDAFLTRLQLVF